MQTFRQSAEFEENVTLSSYFSEFVTISLEYTHG